MAGTAAAGAPARRSGRSDSTIDLLDRKVLYKQGAFEKVVYYFPGWLLMDGERGQVKYTHGWRGKEAHVLRDEIRPAVVFEVVEDVQHGVQKEGGSGAGGEKTFKRAAA